MRLDGINYDITDRKRAEQTLRDSEERFRLFMENSPTLAWVKDEQGRHVYLSKTYEDRFGVRLEDWRGRTDAELWPAETAAQFRKNDLAVLAAEQPLEVTEETLNPDGSRCYWLNSRFFFRDAAGNRYVAGIGLDITRRRQAEEQTRLLSEVTAGLLASDQPQRIVESLCRRIMEHLGCHVFFNFLVDEQAGRLHLNACAGISEEAARQIEWIDDIATACGCVAKDGTHIVAEHIQTVRDPRTDLVRSLGIQAYACYPLLNHGRVIGTLSFGSRTRPMFAGDDLDMMKTVADHVAVAMQRVRLLESLQRHARAAEADNEAKSHPYFYLFLSGCARQPRQAAITAARAKTTQSLRKRTHIKRPRLEQHVFWQDVTRERNHADRGNFRFPGFPIIQPPR